MPDSPYALLSTWDKQGISEIGQALADTGHHLLSTSKTAEKLRMDSLQVIEISDWTGAPEILGGRVKTIHPRIAAGILNTRTEPESERIDFVICNLYPFEQGFARGASRAELIELIDIGGVTLLRAAAKNFSFVTPVPETRWYPEVIAELCRHGMVSQELRRRLAQATFELTSSYDSAIAAALRP